MKKYMKGLLSLLLVVCLAVSAIAVTGIVSSAQIMKKGVYIQFKGAKNGDWVTLGGTSGKVIQDPQLQLLIHNDKKGNPIKILTLSIAGNEADSQSSKAGDVTLDTGWKDVTLDPDEDLEIGLSGSLPSENDSILVAEMSYIVLDEISDITETARAYILASSSQNYTSVKAWPHCTGAFSMAGLWDPLYGADLAIEASPMTSGSATYTEQVIDKGWYAGSQTLRHPTMTSTIYIDGGKYETWDSVGFKFDFILNATASHDSNSKGDPERAAGVIDYCKITQNTSSESHGTMTIGSGSNAVSTSATKKTAESAYDYAESEPSGFLVSVAQNKDDKNVPSSVPVEINGTVPDDAQSSFKIELQMHGVGEGIAGKFMSAQSPQLNLTWNLTVINNDKSSLRDRLKEIAKEGQNYAAYSEGWADFEEKGLIPAYSVLGDIDATPTAVAKALKDLNDYYNALKRYAVVKINHFYYVGKDKSNPVAVNYTQDRVQVNIVNSGAYVPAILPQSEQSYTVRENGRDVTYKFTYNRKTVSGAIPVLDDTNDANYTIEINQYYWNVDDSLLAQRINEYNNFKFEDAAHHPIYDDLTVQAYTAAKEAGEEVMRSTTATQIEFDIAAENLRIAKKNLDPLDVDMEWLGVGVLWAQQIINSQYTPEQAEELELDDYVPYSMTFERDWSYQTLFKDSTYANSLFEDLVSAYNNAYLMIVDDEEEPENEDEPTVRFTQAEVDSAANALWAAIDALRVKDNVTKGIYLSDENIRHANINNYGWYQGATSSKQRNDVGKGLLPTFNDIIDNESGEYHLQREKFTEESWQNLIYALYGVYDSEQFGIDFFEENNFDVKQYYLANSGAPLFTAESYPVTNWKGEVQEDKELNIPAYAMIHNIWFLSSQMDYNACRDYLVNTVNNLAWVVDAKSLAQVYAQASAIDTSEYTNESQIEFNELLEYITGVMEKLGDIDPDTGMPENPQLYGDKDAITSAVARDLALELQESMDNLQKIPVLAPAEGNESDVVIDDGKIIGDFANKTVVEIVQELTVENPESNPVIKIYDIDGEETAEDEKVGTGYTLVLKSRTGTQEYYRAALVVPGDVQGNAEIDNDDYKAVYKYAFTDTGIQEGIYKDAADVNGDGKIDLSDAIMIRMMAKKKA